MTPRPEPSGLEPLATRPILAAGWLAVSTAALAHFLLDRAGAADAWQALVILLVGACSFRLALPMSAIRLARDQQLAAADLARRLEGVNLESRQETIAGVLMSRGDAVGEVSRRVHDCLAASIAALGEARRARRTLHHAVEKTAREVTAQLARESVCDHLTGVGNRRALDAARLALVESARSGNAPRRLVVMMIDVDHFKRINDTLGHGAGDECLVFVARLLRDNVRRADVVVRLGGDEFLVLLPDESLERATALAAHLRSLVRQMNWHGRNIPRPTLSFGLAEARLDRPESLDEAIRLADNALYAAKRSGRNRHAAATGEPVLTR